MPAGAASGTTGNAIDAATASAASFSNAAAEMMTPASGSGQRWV